MIALTLAAVGAILLATAAYLLITSRPQPLGPCTMPSPDNQPCTGTLGHIGWHRHQGLEWFGDAWQLPTGTVAAPRYAEPPAPKRPKATLITVYAGASLGVVAVAIAVTIGYRATQSVEANPHANCAYHWKDAHPGRGLCPDSPDNAPGPARTDWDGRLVNRP